MQDSPAWRRPTPSDERPYTRAVGPELVYQDMIMRIDGDILEVFRAGPRPPHAATVVGCSAGTDEAQPRRDQPRPEEFRSDHAERRSAALRVGEVRWRIPRLVVRHRHLRRAGVPSVLHTSGSGMRSVGCPDGRAISPVAP